MYSFAKKVKLRVGTTATHRQAMQMTDALGPEDGEGEIVSLSMYLRCLVVSNIYSSSKLQVLLGQNLDIVAFLFVVLHVNLILNK
jgi:hypothetical protein